MDPTVIKIKELDLDLINPRTSNYMDPDSYGSKILVIGKPGCFTPGTKVLMFDGTTKNVEDVKIGDQVMGDDSTVRNVEELCHNYDDMYEITPEKGESYTVNKQHKLVLMSEKGNITEVTVENYLNDTQNFKGMKIYKTGVEFQEKFLEKDPYLFGSKLINSNEQLTHEYKINSRENRLLLLAGLLDSNGLCNNETYDFKCINEKLIDDVIFIARSLGFLALKMNKYTCNIYGSNIDEIPCKNLKRVNKGNIDTLSTKFSIKEQGYGEYYGFTLDGNHRFLLGTFDVVRNTGKSTLIASILFAKKHIFPVGMVFSGTEDSNGFFKKILPSTFIYNEYNPEKIEMFIKRQKIARRHIENPWGMIIIDDCTDDPKILATPLQQGMFKRGRHWKSLYILSLQYSMDVKPVIRTNVDGVFILREPILKNRKSLWENYASIIPDFNLFCTILDAVTDDYTALYIHNQTRSNNWQECVFWYKAPLTPEGFKFGAPEYWQFHQDRFNPEYVDSFDKI